MRLLDLGDPTEQFVPVPLGHGHFLPFDHHRSGSDLRNLGQSNDIGPMDAHHIVPVAQILKIP